VHHALCNVIVPIIERTFIAESYANRWGYGTHRALKRFIHHARRHRYILQCDVRKYFPSIDHEILKALIRRKIRCADTLWLIDSIIDGSNEQDPSFDYFSGDTLLTPLERRRGLPIGNLTSQFFANVYLNGFDHYVKEILRCPHYLRYVDDFALFSDDREELAQYRPSIEQYLATLRLTIHPIKSQLFAIEHGANFVGFRLLPKSEFVPRDLCIRVRGDNLRRARRRLKTLQADYGYYVLNLEDVIQRLQSWEAHLKHGDTQGLRRSIFDATPFRRYQALS